MEREKNTGGIFINFILGTLTGAALGFLFAPKSGSKFRKDLQDDLDSYLKRVKAAGDKIVNDAKKTADEIIEKAGQLAVTSSKYVEGNFKEYFEKAESEFRSVKTAINTAVDTYRKNNEKIENSSDAIADEIFIDFVNENTDEYEFESESLPRQEGMRRRHDRKHY